MSSDYFEEPGGKLERRPSIMNNPFRYRPSAEMVRLMWKLCGAISSDPVLDARLNEGKMLGILRHGQGFMFAYSGKRQDGLEKVTVDGTVHEFVPPIFDVTKGYFREKEEEISRLNRLIAAAEGEEAGRLRELRAEESAALQKWTFEQYRVLNAAGECRSMLEIFAGEGLTPPAASGDCAAPKLLQAAFARGLAPVEIGEFWYGRSPEGPVRSCGRFYPACSWKCGPLLRYMLKGMDIAETERGHGIPVLLHEDRRIIVCCKPAGMSAVPGLDGRLSLEEWLKERYGEAVFQVHRLDQDSSGVMVFARDKRSQACLQRQFENRLTDKTYLAICDRIGDGRPRSGGIALPLAPDYEDKPRQKADRLHGKAAETVFRVLAGEERSSCFSLFDVSETPGYDAVEFRPATGRSHQLRVHAAHKDGLGAPLLGDTLYGGGTCHRLCLHAARLSFVHPETGETVSFSCP